MGLNRRLQFGLARDAALLFWAMFFLQVAFGASDRFKPLYIESLGASPALVGIVLGVAEFIRLLFLIAAGPLSDRISPGVLLKTRWFAVGNALIFVIATQWWQLFPAFLLQAAANFAWPTVSTTIDQAGDAASRNRRFLLVYAIAPNAPLLFAPFIGGLVAEELGLRPLFVILTVGLIVSASFFSLVRPPQRVRRVTSGGYGAVIRHRPTALLCALNASGMFVAWLGLTLAPNYLNNVSGLSYAEIGLLGTLVAVGSIGMGLTLSKVRRLSQSMNGTLLTFAALPLVFGLLLGGDGLAMAGAAYLCWGIASVAQQTFYSAISDVTPVDLRTRSFALLEVSYSAGIMVAGFASGLLYGIDPQLPFWIALIGAIAVVIATILVRRSIAGWRQSDIAALAAIS